MKFPLLFFLFLTISLVSGAQSSLGIFKQHECANLIQICDNCTYNNISAVTYPNSTVAISDVVMTKADTYYNYTFCLTSETGEYNVNGYGDLDGTKTVWSYTLEVTPSGQEQKSILNNTMLIILFGLGIFFLVMGIKLQIVWMGFISSVVFLLGGVYVMIYGFNDITNFYTQGVGLVLLGTAIIIMFVSAYEWVFVGEKEE